MRGTLEGHSGWVTSLATSLEKSVNLFEHFIAQLLTVNEVQICFFPAAVTKLSSSGISPATNKTMDIQNEVFTATPTLFQIAYVSPQQKEIGGLIMR